MALTITVNGAGTFTASMEEGPVSFSASLGAIGPAGPGVAAGGTTGQILVKTSNADYATGWIDNAARTVFVTARNNTGSTIAKGAVVYLSGATGNKATIALAQANSEATSARTIGITKAEIANGADGDVIISGEIANIDTSAFAAGTVVYLSATTAGGLTTTLPTQPNHGVVIGIVTRQNANNGSIEVTVQNYQELKELSDVLVSNPQNGQALIYETSSGVWKNLAIPAPDLSAYLTSATAAATYQTIAGMSDYLSKAGNLSGLASTATARTNLGLGTMATETASDYLTKAGNLSGLASNATARTNLDVYSKSESDALVPAASTTTAGKVELATEAEAIGGTDTSRAVTPKAARAELTSSNHIRIVHTSLSNTNVGTITAVNTGLYSTRVRPGTAGACSSRQRLFGTSQADQASYSEYSSLTGYNFDNPRIITGRYAVTLVNDSNFRAGVVHGKADADAVGDLARKGMGWYFTGGTAPRYLVLQVHDGTTLTNVTSTHEISATTVFDWAIEADGSGNVSLIVNGTQVATTSAGPVGASTTSTPAAFQQETIASAALASGFNDSYFTRGNLYIKGF